LVFDFFNLVFFFCFFFLIFSFFNFFFFIFFFNYFRLTEYIFETNDKNYFDSREIESLLTDMMKQIRLNQTAEEDHETNNQVFNYFDEVSKIMNENPSLIEKAYKNIEETKRSIFFIDSIIEDSPKEINKKIKQMKFHKKFEKNLDLELSLQNKGDDIKSKIEILETELKVLEMKKKLFVSVVNDTLLGLFLKN
jgi:hypothetical protein